MRGAIAGLTIAAIAAGCGGAQPQPTVVLRRVFMIGDADQIAQDPDGAKAIDGYETTVALGAAAEVVAADRVRTPPSPCGAKIGHAFLDKVLERFNINGLRTCSMSEVQVDCRSAYLPPPYDTTMFQLKYDYVAEKFVKISVEVLRRENSGHLAASELKEEDRKWFNELFGQLNQMAYCQ